MKSIKEIDLKYSLDYDYDSSYDCSESISCDDYICRCLSIDNVSIDNVEKLTADELFFDSFVLGNIFSPKELKELKNNQAKFFLIANALNSIKIQDSDDFDISVISSYYGDEVDAINFIGEGSNEFDKALKLIFKASDINTCNKLNKLINYKVNKFELKTLKLKELIFDEDSLDNDLFITPSMMKAQIITTDTPQGFKVLYGADVALHYIENTKKYSIKALVVS